MPGFSLKWGKYNVYPNSEHSQSLKTTVFAGVLDNVMKRQQEVSDKESC